MPRGMAYRLVLALALLRCTSVAADDRTWVSGTLACRSWNHGTVARRGFLCIASDGSVAGACYTATGRVRGLMTGTFDGACLAFTGCGYHHIACPADAVRW